MLNFELEHMDDFNGDKIFWLQANNVEQEYIEQAKHIDKENFLLECFGICVNYSNEDKEYMVCQDKFDCELYYVDNDGDKHWLNYKLTKEECEKAVKFCSRIAA